MVENKIEVPKCCGKYMKWIGQRIVKFPTMFRDGHMEDIFECDKCFKQKKIIIYGWILTANDEKFIKENKSLYHRGNTLESIPEKVELSAIDEKKNANFMHGKNDWVEILIEEDFAIKIMKAKLKKVLLGWCEKSFNRKWL